MKRVLIFVAGIVTAALFTSCSFGQLTGMEENHPVDYYYSREELQKDFNRFRRIIETKTVRLYTDMDELTNSLNAAEEAITTPMTELEFCRLLAPIVADLRCGHSFISISTGSEEFLHTEALFFPLDVRIIENRLFVIRDPHDTGVEPAAEVVSINGVSVEEILETLYKSIPTDGYDTGRIRYDAERWFSAMYYTYIGTPDNFVLQVVLPDNSILTITLPAVRDPGRAQTAQGIMFDTANTPWSVTFGDYYARITIPTFSYSDHDEYSEFLHSCFSEIKKRKIEHVILDLRGNYGGTPFPTVELFRYLIDEPVPFFSRDNPFYLNPWEKKILPAENAFTGRLRILIDEAGFSMNAFLVSLLKYHRIGTLIGSVTSGGYKCSDASRTVTLPGTGLRFRYSTAVFQTAVHGFPDATGIEPDIEVIRSVEDYIEGRDPVLQAAMY